MWWTEDCRGPRRWPSCILKWDAGPRPVQSFRFEALLPIILTKTGTWRMEVERNSSCGLTLLLLTPVSRCAPCPTSSHPPPSHQWEKKNSEAEFLCRSLSGSTTCAGQGSRLGQKEQFSCSSLVLGAQLTLPGATALQGQPPFVRNLGKISASLRLTAQGH